MTDETEQVDQPEIEELTESEVERISGLNIYQRVNEVRKDISYLRKEKQVGSGNMSYKVVTHDQVTGAIRELLIKYGVMVVPNELDGQVILTGTETAGGTPWIRYESKYRISFVNCDDPDQKIDIEVAAHALDTGDKAPGKALSYATKMAMLKLFSIETGEDEEERPEQRRGDEGFTPQKLYKRASLHMTAVMDNIETVTAIKGYLAAGDLDAAAEAWAEVTDVKVISALAMAPTKGGCFTVAEGKLMKSDEFKGFMLNHRQDNPLVGL